METPSASNIKILAKTVDSADLDNLWNDTVDLVTAGQVDSTWTIYHVFKEINKRYLEAFGVPLDATHDGGMAPLSAPEPFGDFVLLESSSGSSLDYVLLENGNRVILE